MLDAFLEVAYKHEKRASDYHELVQSMTKLPKEELYALAEGHSKLAYGPDGDSWLEKFRGTPFHEQALALEQQSLEIDIAQEQKRLAEQEQRDARRDSEGDLYRQQDAIRLKKRILDLELNKSKLEQAGVGQVEESDDDEDDEDDEDEPLALNPVEKAASKQKVSGFVRKTAAKKEDKGLPLKAMVGVPLAATGVGAGLGGLAEAARAAHRAGPLSLSGVPRSALRGGALGAGIGLGTAGLLGVGHMLRDTDPRVLQTVGTLAPAAAATYGALRDEPKESLASVKPTLVPGEDPQQFGYPSQSMGQAEAVGRMIGLPAGAVGGGMAGSRAGGLRGGGWKGKALSTLLGATGGGLMGGELGASAAKTLAAPGVVLRHGTANLPPEAIQALQEQAARMGKDVPSTELAGALGREMAPKTAGITLKQIESMRKQALSVTPEGHAYDAAMARIAREAMLEQARLGQEHDVIGYREGEGTHTPPFGKTIRHVLSTPYQLGEHPTVAARHADYVASKHEQGRNALNPFGGLLTPLSEEEGGTTGFFSQVGKVKPKEGQKTSSATPTQIARMRKQAQLGAAIKAGLTGAKGFLAGAGKNVGAAYKGGWQGAAPGMKGALSAGKEMAGAGVQRMGQFAAKNPGAAAALGGGALGATALGAGGLGYAAG